MAAQTVKAGQGVAKREAGSGTSDRAEGPGEAEAEADGVAVGLGSVHSLAESEKAASVHSLASSKLMPSVHTPADSDKAALVHSLASSEKASSEKAASVHGTTSSEAAASARSVRSAKGKGVAAPAGGSDGMYLALQDSCDDLCRGFPADARPTEDQNGQGPSSSTAQLLHESVMASEAAAAAGNGARSTSSEDSWVDDLVLSPRAAEEAA